MSLANTLFRFEIAARAAQDGKANRRRRALPPNKPTDLFLCLVDHFEPQIGRPTQAVARARMDDWMRRYPPLARRHRDAEGRVPTHGFFYPWDEYEAWEFARLTELCAAGYGEIELHLHHRDDTAATLSAKLDEAISVYHAQGAFPLNAAGKPAFAFIHGNWALDNSRQDGGRNYCGVNNEMEILKQRGCYADFTFPAWSQTAQPRQTNAIYYATDDPRPKSYDRGVPARAGAAGQGDLLLIQGPLVPYRASRGGIPRLAVDDGDLASYRRYRPERLDRWVQAGIHVQGRPDCLFVKLHTHGAADQNREALLGSDLEALFTDAETRYNDGTRYRLHYVTAREMYNIVKALETGEELAPEAMRNWVLKPPIASAPAPAAVST